MKKLLTLLSFFGLVGCTIVPPEQIDTSWLSKPKEGNAGVYVYQHRRGIFGALYDIPFRLRSTKNEDYTEYGRVNTGEYFYIELPEGYYEYDTKPVSITIFDSWKPIKLQSGHNYFFRAYMMNAMGNMTVVPFMGEVRETAQLIKEGKLEEASVD